jgi:hypothetical protein
MSSFPLIPPVLLVLLLFVTTVLIHYEGLRLISLGVEKIRSRPRPRVLIVIFGVVCIHLVEIALFAGAIYALDTLPYEGGLIGRHIGELAPGTATLEETGLDALGYFYVSAQTYSTLGYGDFVATGDLRVLTSIEPLMGLLLIGWSTSFTFLAMQRLWKLHTPSERASSGQC